MGKVDVTIINRFTGKNVRTISVPSCVVSGLMTTGVIATIGVAAGVVGGCVEAISEAIKKRKK